MRDTSRHSGHGSGETEPAPDHTQPYEEVDALASSKSSKSPAFQFYPEAFLGSTKVMAMSYTERGIYITLLCACWMDGSIPAEVGAIARLLKLKESQFARMWRQNLAPCFVERAGRLINARIERERKKQKLFREQRKTAADTRWQKSDASAMHVHSETDARNQTPASPPQSSLSLSVVSLSNLSTKEKNVSAASQSDTTPVVLTFPTSGTPKSWELHQSQVDAWCLAFPNLDILAECRKAHAWLDAATRKTARGMPRFLVSWFGRAVNQGHVNGAQRREPQWVIDARRESES